MTKKVHSLLWLGAVVALAAGLTGCVAIPPLINVQHRDATPETNKKLDAIEKRLQTLEQNLDQKK